MEKYRLARMVEGSVYNFVVATMKSACEFLRSDPLIDTYTRSPQATASSSNSSSNSSSSSSSSSNANFRSRSTSFGSKPNSAPAQHVDTARFYHRKTQSEDLQGRVDFPSIDPHQDDDDYDQDCGNNNNHSSSNHSNNRRNSANRRPHMVLPNPRYAAENRKSLDDLPNDWLHIPSPEPTPSLPPPPVQHTSNLANSKPMVSSTPVVSNSTPLPMDPNSTTGCFLTTSSSPDSMDTRRLARSQSASTVKKRTSNQAPRVITIPDRISFDGIPRPASICLDTRSLHSIEDGSEESEEKMGAFLIGLSKMDGNVVGGSLRRA
jgi:hypothetical protein